VFECLDGLQMAVVRMDKYPNSCFTVQQNKGRTADDELKISEGLMVCQQHVLTFSRSNKLTNGQKEKVSPTTWI